MNNSISRAKDIALIVFVLLNPFVILSLTSNIWSTLLVSIVSVLFLLLVCRVNRYKWISVIAANLVCFASILIYTESIFRVVYPEKNIPNLYESRGKYYFDRPLIKETFVTSEYATIYHTDISGYRINPCHSPYNVSDSCDILFIGDSFTQGAQVNYNDMFTSIIEDSLKCVCINAGISGAGVCDEYYYFVDKGRKCNPKYVVLQVGVFNDFFNIAVRQTGFKQKLIEKSAFYRYLHFTSNYRPNTKMDRWCEPFFDTREGNADYNILFKESSPQKEMDKQNFIITLNSFNEVVKKNGGQLILCLIPSKEQVSNDCLQEVLEAYDIDIADVDLLFPNLWLKEITRKSDIPYIDLLSSFRESEVFPYFEIDEHMNEIGHKLVAKEIVKYFKER